MKKLVFFLISVVLTVNIVFSQTIPIDSLYLGQKPPGDSAVIFAPGIISLTNRRETKIVFSPNGEECLIGIGINNTYKILYTNFNNGKWETPIPAYFISADRAQEPFFSPDSLHVFYTSNANIYMSNRINNIWSTPIMLASSINSNYEEYHPTSTINGTLYFCSMRENASGFIYRSRYENGNYSTVEKLDDVINRHNSQQDGAYDPFIAPDESFIIFSSIRSGGYGREDQYISYNRNGVWTNPKNLGSSINSYNIEYGSYLSNDYKYYFFSRPLGWSPNIGADIYWIKINEIIDKLKCTNFLPYIKKTIPNQTDTVGQFFQFTIPDSTFIDDDGNHTLSFSAKLYNDISLPEWLTFDSLTCTFSGTPSENQTYKIKVTATDTAGASISTTFTIGITTSSIDYPINKNEWIKVFPNPTKGLIKISLDNVYNEMASIEIENILGKKIFSNIFSNELVVDLTNKPNGVYLIKLIYRDKTFFKRVCKE